MKDAYPDIDIQLVPVPRSFSLSQREADVAVMIGRPEKGRLRSRKLVDYSLGLYAAKTYLAERGSPVVIKDLSDHRLIGYVDDLIFSPALHFRDEYLSAWNSEIEISSSLGQFEAVKSGAGIAILHDFMAADEPNLIRLFPERSVQLSYYTVWHESMKNTLRVAAVVQFLNAIARENRPLFRPESGVT